MNNDEFIRAHREDDVRRLALTRPPEGVDLRWCLQQIEGWQLARQKLPTWATMPGLHYPPRLSMEQCSSEATAQYKRSVAERLLESHERQSMTDLTGGLGIDFSYLAPLFREATYVEKMPHLVDLARHNMPLLLGQKGNGSDEKPGGATRLRFVVANEAVAHVDVSSLIFLDPARRDESGRKTVGIADCTPNLLDLQDVLLASSRWVMVKLSPMLDITEALRQLHGVREVHVVSLQGECKELLFVASAGAQSSPTIHCVNLGTDDDTLVTTLAEREKKAATCATLPSDLLAAAPHYLYEPNASILKAGVQDTLCERYGVGKLHPASNLFVADNLVPHFPGRRFRITGLSDFGKRNLRHFIGDLRQANLTVRNFPTPVAQLRRQLKLAEGGDTYLFATTLADGSHALIRCQKP